MPVISDIGLRPADYERLRLLAKLAGRHPREQAAIYLEEAVRQAQTPPAHELTATGSPAATEAR